MDIEKLTIEKINNLKDTRSSMWLAIIAVSGAISAIIINIPDIKTSSALIARLVILMPAILLDIGLILSLGSLNKTINKLFARMEE